MTSTPEDAELVARAQRGDVGAFGVLYQRYYKVIYRYLRSRLSEDPVAEDMTAAVFLRSFEALDSYRERGWPFSAFLYRVAKNLLADHFRRKRPEVPFERADLAATDSLDERVVEEERTQVLRQALEALPRDYQEVIRLRVLLGLPTAMAATWLGRSEGATRVLLSRALERLRQEVLRDGEPK
ncbi:MAG: sigma-70 family RNA polymerase sigma factor [Chloroflexota bacterium]